MMPDMRRAVVLISLLVLIACDAPPKRSSTAIRKDAEKYMEFGNPAEAQVLLAELVDRDPTRWYDQFALGRAAMENGDLGQARMALEVASTLRPADHRIAVDLASVLYQLEARDDLFRYLRDRAQTTQTPKDWLQLARYAMDCDDPDTARLSVRIGIALDEGESATPYLLAAQIARQLGEDADAKRALVLAWRADPENEQVNTLLRDMGIVPGPTLEVPPGSSGQ
jgi:tetratricopeptide (TPR) repeat protein